MIIVDLFKLFHQRLTFTNFLQGYIEIVMWVFPLIKRRASKYSKGVSS